MSLILVIDTISLSVPWKWHGQSYENSAFFAYVDIQGLGQPVQCAGWSGFSLSAYTIMDIIEYTNVLIDRESMD